MDSDEDRADRNGVRPCSLLVLLAHLCASPFICGSCFRSAGTQNRTVDTGIFSPVLYQLSYPGQVAGILEENAFIVNCSTRPGTDIEPNTKTHGRNQPQITRITQIDPGTETERNHRDTEGTESGRNCNSVRFRHSSFAASWSHIGSRARLADKYDFGPVTDAVVQYQLGQVYPGRQASQ